MSFETHFFPFWERTKNVLRHTRKKCLLFRNSCLSQTGVIDDTKVSDRQRRCCAPCRNIIGCKSSFTCHVPLGFCLRSCWVQFKVRFLSFSDNNSVLFGTCNQVQLSIYVSSAFPQSGFRLHSLENLLFIVVLHITLWFKRHRLGIVQSVDLLNMIQIQTGHLFFVVVIYNIISKGIIS